MRIGILVAALFAAIVFAQAGSAQPPAKGKNDPKGKADPKAKAEPESKYNMKLTAADIRLGTHVVGVKVDPADLKGRVVLVDYWGIDCAPCLQAMPRMAELNSELSGFGLLIIGSHVQEGEADKVRAVALSHKANFPISIQTRVRGSEDNRFIPHCLLFDHTGKCVFRGDPTAVEPFIRKAVGAALIAAAGREKFTTTVEPILKELRAGKPPAPILARVSAMRNYSGEAGADAKALLASMTAGGRKKLEEAAEKKDSDPVEAFLLIEKLPTAYKGTPLAQEATELLGKLRKEKAVTAELSARQYMEGVRKLDHQLGLGASDPRKPEFQKAYAPLLRQLRDKVTQMKRAWPDARTTKEALEIADRYGVEIK
jgi:thiol-disulfide isomerase/thioredoxin